MGINVSVKVLSINGGSPPEYATGGSAGCDLFANLERNVTLNPGERKLIPTGIIMEIPVGYEGQIRPRSGLAVNHGITVLNSPGTIDSDYRGEIKIALINLGKEPYTIRNKDRIAQLIVSSIQKVEISVTHNTSETLRGNGGFGSTGK